MDQSELYRRPDEKDKWARIIENTVISVLIAFCFLIPALIYLFMKTHMMMLPLSDDGLVNEPVARTKAAALMIYLVPFAVFCVMIYILDIVSKCNYSLNPRTRLFQKKNREKLSKYSDDDLKSYLSNIPIGGQIHLPDSIEQQVLTFNIDLLKKELDWRKSRKKLMYLKSNFAVYILIAVIFFIIGNAWI